MKSEEIRYDEPLSDLAFNFHLRRYTMVVVKDRRVAEAAAAMIVEQAASYSRAGAPSHAAAAAAPEAPFVASSKRGARWMHRPASAKPTPTCDPRPAAGGRARSPFGRAW